MKNRLLLGAVFAAAVGAATAAHAKRIDDAAIYNALTVPERTDFQNNTVSKSVGGLDCVRTDRKPAPSTFACKLSLEQADPGAIYEALDAPAEMTAGNRPKVNFTKTVDGLSCTKTENPASRTPVTYSCRLTVD